MKKKRYGTVEMIYNVDLNSYKSAQREYRKETKSHKILPKQERNLKMNDKNEADENMPLSDIFPNSVKEIKLLSENEIKKEVEDGSAFETNLKKNEKNQADKIKFLSENEVKKEVENDSDFKILSINNDEINEEIREVDIKKEYSSHVYADVLENCNQFPDTPEDPLKTENENDLDFETLPINADKIKIEIVEADMKKECFGDHCDNILGYNNQQTDVREDPLKTENENDLDLETLPIDANEIKIEIVEADMKKECFGDHCDNKLGYNNQPTGVRVGEEYHVAIEDTSELEKDSKENLPTVTTDEMSFQSNELNISVVRDSEPTIEKKVDESVSTSIHTGNRTYSCQVCNKSFTHKSKLVLHERIHTRETPYSCEVCKQSFTHKSSLFYHARRHTGEKPYSCQVCEKSFTQKSTLVNHQRVHTGERPYSCQVCEKSFTNKLYLVRHNKRIHSGEKPYSCQICEKSFTQKSTLVNHQRLHTGEKPYSCRVCEKSFTNISTLVNHQRLHTGEKPYSCQVCKKLFTDKSNLIRHKRIHSGE